MIKLKEKPGSFLFILTLSLGLTYSTVSFAQNKSLCKRVLTSNTILSHSSKPMKILVNNSILMGRKLLQQYPPQSHVYVFLGLQNVGISEAVRQLDSQSTVIDLPVQGLNWTSVIEPRWTEDFLIHQIQTIRKQTKKEIVFVRTLNFGSTMERIFPIFDYLSENLPNLKLNFFFVASSLQNTPNRYLETWGPNRVRIEIDQELIAVATEQGKHTVDRLTQEDLAKLSRVQILDAKAESPNRKYDRNFRWTPKDNAHFEKLVRSAIR